MSEITTIGLNLAKSVFQVHVINDAGGEVTRRAAPLQRARAEPLEKGRVCGHKMREG
jgi:hypothetical protein